MNPALRRSAAHVFVESLAAPQLDDSDAHHLTRVLRLRSGQSVSVADGLGGWRTCRYLDGGGLEIDSEIVVEPVTTPQITIAFALPKGDRPEWIVQKLTEIGTDRIVILHAERSVTRWDGDRAPRQMDKLRVVARQASMQSRRVRLPSIDGPSSPAAVVAADAVAGGPGVAIAEPGGVRPTLGRPTVLIGPEGGWSPTEMSIEAVPVALGETILRVETAALVASSRLVALRNET